VVNTVPSAATKAIFALWLGLPHTKRTACPSLLGAKDEHPFDVPGHGHKSPFTANPVDPTQHELPEAHHGFDNPEYWFWDLFA
jgi:hypothetical protein